MLKFTALPIFPDGAPHYLRKCFILVLHSFEFALILAYPSLKLGLLACFLPSFLLPPKSKRFVFEIVINT
jgi:hypothetical protein